MATENLVLEWLKKDFLKQWKQLIEINKSYNAKNSIHKDQRRIIFPFIPIDVDGYALRNFLAFIMKFLFEINPNSFILILNETNDSLIWAAFQKVEFNSITGLIEFDNNLQMLSPLLSIENNLDGFTFLQDFLEKQGISSELGFYLKLNISTVSEFRTIYEEYSNLLDFYSRIWDWLSTNFKNQNIQFFPEPLFFEFLRKLTTLNITFNALQFQQLFGNLLPSQDLIITFLDKDNFSSIAFITKPNSLQIRFLDQDVIQNFLNKVKDKSNKGLEFFNKLIKNKVILSKDHQKVKPTAAITFTEDFWKRIQNIMTQYSFENMIDQYFEIIKEVEEKWTIEREIILFRRWGKSFMGFQLQKLIPTQFSSIMTSIIRFFNECQTRMVWFVVNDALELIYILETDYKHGLFQRTFMISDPYLFEIFNSEPNKELAVKKAHFYFAEHRNWINQLIVIIAQDLNHLVAFLPLLTTIKGSLKYLNMIENIINYRMFFYPPNFFADLIGRKGATYFFKNIIFPEILKKSD